MTNQKNLSVKKITHKQEIFAIEYIMNGGNASDAYRAAYNVKKSTKPASIWREAHNVLHNIKVTSRINELREMTYGGHILSIQERKELLSRWAENGSIKAIDILNKMENVYVKKIDHSGKIHARFILNLMPIDK